MRWLSPDIVNGLSTLIGNDLLQQVLSTIRHATWYAVGADETADVANQEQLSLPICWVGKADKIMIFIGLVHVPIEQLQIHSPWPLKMN